MLKGKVDESAVIILAITKNNEFVLLIEPRVFTKETVDIRLLTLYVKNNEEQVVCTKRELLEETGYETK